MRSCVRVCAFILHLFFSVQAELLHATSVAYTMYDVCVDICVCMFTRVLQWYIFFVPPILHRTTICYKNGFRFQELEARTNRRYTLNKTHTFTRARASSMKCAGPQAALRCTFLEQKRSICGTSCALWVLLTSSLPFTETACNYTLRMKRCVRS